MTETIWIAVAAAAVIGLAAGALIVFVARPKAQDDRTGEHMAALNARLDAMGSWLNKSQGQMQESVNQRLDAVTARLGESLSHSTNTTAEHLQNLHARLAVIDSAQKNITDLATTVSTLQKVFDNKQRRGAFGQGRMEAIVADALPQGAYEFQFTLSNQSRPDCCVRMPDNRHLVIDAKFPLEATTALEAARTDDERLQATRQLRVNLGKHIDDISTKYLIKGETQDVAFMFIPSESMFAELHDSFDDVLQKGYRAGVIIVSPSLLMLAIQVVQQIQKDARMREAADKILKEVGLMIEDVERLKDRVDGLDKHFGTVSKDIQLIVTSAEKILSRGEKIQGVEFEDALPPSAEILAGPGSGAGTRRLAGE
jgi:DNA recombination protein RmuC